MIPIALSGDRSFNKDTIRRYVSEGSRVIPGCSTVIFENGSLGSYYNFLVKHDEDYTIRFDDVQSKYLEFISKKLALGKRVHELVVLKCLLNGQAQLMSELKTILEEDYHLVVKDKTITNVVNVLTNEFPSGTGKNTYKECIFIVEDGDDYRASDAFITALSES